MTIGERPIRDDADFEAMMLEGDEQLRKEGVPIPARVAATIASAQCSAEARYHYKDTDPNIVAAANDAAMKIAYVAATNAPGGPTQPLPTLRGNNGGPRTSSALSATEPNGFTRFSRKTSRARRRVPTVETVPLRMIRTRQIV